MSGTSEQPIDSRAVHELQLWLKWIAAEWLAFSKRMSRDPLAITIGKPVRLAHQNTQQAMWELARVYEAAVGKPHTMVWVSRHAEVLDAWECLWGSPTDPEPDQTQWDDYAEWCLESLRSDECRQALADWKSRLDSEDIAGVLAEWPEAESAVQRAGDSPAADAFVPAASLWPEKFPDYKKFKREFDKIPDAIIRRRKPSPQRLEIHAGDWSRYWSQKETEGFASMDETAIANAAAEVRKSRRK